MAYPFNRLNLIVADDKDVDAIRDDSSGSNVSDAANNIKKQKLAIKLQDPKQNGDCLTLVDFPDEILHEIFKHLDSCTILALMNSAARFVNLLLDKRFWHDIDLSQKPLPLGILEDVLLRSNEGTHTIKVRGPPSGHHVAWESTRLTTTLRSIFPNLRTTLQVLELEGVSLDFDIIHITDFPTSLKKLAFKDCSAKVKDGSIVLRTMETHLKDLDELGIEDCDWFDPYYLIIISKLPILRKLSLKGCKVLTKFEHYSAMAARFGFHKLEILDLRFTSLNNNVLRGFIEIKSLRQLLLDCPLKKLQLKETEPGNETELLSDESKNNKAGPMKETSSERNDQQRQQNLNQRPYVCHHPRAYHFEQVLDSPMAHIRSIEVNDITMYNFVRASNPLYLNNILMEINIHPIHNRLERIELRNYRKITDLTLQYLVPASPNLVYLDVSGTGVTRAGVRVFQERMPKCEVVASHITEKDNTF